ARLQEGGEQLRKERDDVEAHRRNPSGRAAKRLFGSRLTSRKWVRGRFRQIPGKPTRGVFMPPSALQATFTAPAALAVPKYLDQTYWWAYVHPKAVQVFERDWLVNTILFG